MTYIIFDAESTGLDPSENGMVTCIATINVETEERKVFQVREDLNEKRMLTEFWDYIKTIKFPNLTGYNSSSFDLTYIIHRSIVREVYIPKFNQTDLRLTANSFFFSYEKKVSGKLSYWAGVLGIPVTTSNGSEMVRYFLDGKYDLIRDHNLEDVEVTFALFKRLCKVGLINERGEKFTRYPNGNF